MKLSLLKFKKYFLFVNFLFPAILPVTGQIHTITMQGHVTLVDDGNDLLNGNIEIGDSLNGIIKYGLNATDNNPLAEVGDYWYYASPSGIQVYISNYSFITDNTNVSFLVEAVNNYQGLDNIVFHSYNNLFSTIPYDFLTTEISWQLDDVSEAAISNTELPLYIDLAAWQQPFGLTIYGTTDFDYPLLIRAVITSIDTGSIAVSVQNQNAQSNNAVKIIPNPSDGIFSIYKNAVNGSLGIQVYNSYGRKLSMDKIDSDAMRVDLSSEPPGIYFLELKGYSGIVMIKLIKR